MARTGLDYIMGGFGSLQDAFAQIAQIKQREEMLGLEKKKMETAAEEARIEREHLERGTQGLQNAFEMPVGQPEVAMGPPTAEGAMPLAGDYTEADKQQAMLEAGLDMYMGGNAALGNKIVDQTLFPDPGENAEMLAAQLAKTRADTERIQAGTLQTRMEVELTKAKLAGNPQFLAQKGVLANLFAAQAQQAKTPEEKIRLTGLSAAIGQAEDGMQLANMLDKGLGVKHAATPFNALMDQNGGDAVAALKTIEEIKNAGRKDKPKNFGSTLESYASAYFNKTPFFELSPENQQNVIQMVQQEKLDANLEEIKAEAKEKPMQATAAKQITDINQIMALGQRVIDQLKPEFVGKLQSHGSRWKDFVGSDPELSKFLGSWARFESYVMRPESGASIGILERDDIKKFIGSIDSNFDSLLSRLTNFMEIVERQRNSIATMATTPGGEVIEKLDKEREEGRYKPEKPPAPAAPGSSTGVPPVEPSGRITEPLPPEQVKKGEQLLEGLGIPLQ